MDEIINHIIIKILKDVGYQKFTKKSLTFMSDYIQTYIKNILKQIKYITNHSQRSKTTISDILNIINIKNLKIKNIEKSEYLSQTVEPLVITKNQEFIYVYSFMPPFPSAHTYKKTIVTEKDDDKSKRIKIKRKQVLDVEKNLYVLLRNRNEIKNYVNFMFP